MNCDGEPYVIEYNCRMGDPETEVVIPRIKSDLLDLLEGVGKQNLHEKSFEVINETATTVVLVSGGYPEDYEKGKPVKGLETIKESQVFHSGTLLKGEEVITSGGRVFAITSFSNNIKGAVDKSMKAAQQVHYDKKYYRKDIGQDLIDWNS
jgi:phosphoribosylamine--glycine ligase